VKLRDQGNASTPCTPAEIATPAQAWHMLNPA